MDARFRNLIAKTMASEGETRALVALVEHLTAASVQGIEAKLDEYRGRSAEPLIAELRMATALSDHTRAAITLQAGAAHDLYVRAHDLDCTVEVQLKSSVDPPSAVFHPEPDRLTAYEHAAGDWKAAAWTLHQTLEKLPVEIQPWLDGDLSAPRWSHSERADQEDACGQVARWLVEKLNALRPGESTQLVHQHARFDIRPIDTAPGRILGTASLEAFILRDHDDGTGVSLPGWLRAAIVAKSASAARYPERRGAQHLVGLVIDEAFACTGYDLGRALLGGLVAELSDDERPARSYRPVPASGIALLAEAHRRGRSAILDAMMFDPKKAITKGGLLFEATVHEHVDGVLALYHPGWLQFIPNPFSPREIESVCSLFPATMAPFAPRPCE